MLPQQRRTHTRGTRVWSVMLRLVGDKNDAVLTHHSFSFSSSLLSYVISRAQGCKVKEELKAVDHATDWRSCCDTSCQQRETKPRSDLWSPASLLTKLISLINHWNNNLLFLLLVLCCLEVTWCQDFKYLKAVLPVDGLLVSYWSHCFLNYSPDFTRMRIRSFNS